MTSDNDNDLILFECALGLLLTILLLYQVHMMIRFPMRFNYTFLPSSTHRFCGRALKEDGVIFISIDDNEIENLRRICDEIFGEENFIAQLIWEKTRKNDAKYFSTGHEYILVYSKNMLHLRETEIIWREQKPGAEKIYNEYLRLRKVYGEDYSKIENELRSYYQKLPNGHQAKKHSRYNKVDERGVWRDDNMSWPGGGGPTYDVIHPVTKKPCKVPPGGWRYSTPEKMIEMIQKGVVIFREDHSEPPIRKTYLVRGDDDSIGDENIGSQVMGTYFYRSALQASSVLTELLGGKVFDNPKDHEVLARLISYVSNENDIVMDFFAGSATTAHGVLELNHNSNKNYRYIVVQLPEQITKNNKEQKNAYDFCKENNLPLNIAEIGKERIRRVRTKILSQSHGQLELEDKTSSDLGFKVLKLDKSNFKQWQLTPAEEVTQDQITDQLNLHVDHVDSDSQEDILYELLIKAGFMPTEKVEKMTLADKTVYAIAEGALLICLEDEITAELIDAVADLEPAQFICLDAGFKENDQLKANAVQTFKSRSRDSEMGMVFKVV